LQKGLYKMKKKLQKQLELETSVSLKEWKIIFTSLYLLESKPLIGF